MYEPYGVAPNQPLLQVSVQPNISPQNVSLLCSQINSLIHLFFDIGNYSKVQHNFNRIAELLFVCCMCVQLLDIANSTTLHYISCLLPCEGMTRLALHVSYELYFSMQAKGATKRGEYDKMHKWKRIAIILNSVAFGLITVYYLYILLNYSGLLYASIIGNNQSGF